MDRAAATPMPTPTPMATWLLEPWLWDAVVIAGAGADEAGIGEVTGWLVIFGGSVVPAVEEDEVLVVYEPGRVATPVAFPSNNTRDDVEQQFSPSFQQQKSPLPHGRSPCPLPGSRDNVSALVPYCGEEVTNS